MGTLNWIISFCLQRCVFGGVYLSSFNKVSEVSFVRRYASGIALCERCGCFNVHSKRRDRSTALYR